MIATLRLCNFATFFRERQPAVEGVLKVKPSRLNPTPQLKQNQSRQKSSKVVKSHQSSSHLISSLCRCRTFAVRMRNLHVAESFATRRPGQVDTSSQQRRHVVFLTFTTETCTWAVRYRSFFRYAFHTMRKRENRRRAFWN